VLGKLISSIALGCGLYLAAHALWLLLKWSWIARDQSITRTRIMHHLRYIMATIYGVAMWGIWLCVIGDGQTTSYRVSQAFFVIVSAAIFLTGFLTHVDQQVAELQARARTYARESS
jgi:hypothetical protein